MTEKAGNLLQEIARSKRYPVVRFELKSTKDRSLRSTALNHVRIQKADEGIEEIKERGAALQRVGGGGNGGYRLCLACDALCRLCRL